MSGYFYYYHVLKTIMYLMQTMYTMIRRLVLRRLIRVYIVCQCPFYGTLRIHMSIYIHLHNTLRFPTEVTVKIVFVPQWGKFFPFRVYLFSEVNYPAHNKTYNVACAISEDTDQPAHPRSLIIVFADRMCLLQPRAIQRGMYENPGGTGQIITKTCL